MARLRQFGVSEVIINVHHFADKVVEHLRTHGNFGMHIEISREEELLDTGGGLKKASYFFLEGGDEPFLVHNVDVLSSIDLGRMVQFHRERGALATLAVQHRDTSRPLLFDAQEQLCGRKPRGSEAEIVRPAATISELAFCGVHVISPRIFAEIAEEGVFPIVPVYLRLAGQGEKILDFRADEYYWRDLGKPESIQQAARDLQDKIVMQ